MKMLDYLNEIKEKMNLENKYFIIKVIYNELKKVVTKKEIKWDYYFVAPGDENTQFRFWKNVILVPKSGYTFDSDQNLILLKENSLVSETIPAKKHYILEEYDTKETTAGQEKFFLRLPLIPTWSISEIDRADIEIKWLNLEEEITEHGLKNIISKNDEAIKYDAFKNTYIMEEQKPQLLDSNHDEKVEAKITSEKLTDWGVWKIPLENNEKPLLFNNKVRYVKDEASDDLKSNKNRDSHKASTQSKQNSGWYSVVSNSSKLTPWSEQEEKTTRVKETCKQIIKNSGWNSAENNSLLTTSLNYVQRGFDSINQIEADNDTTCNPTEKEMLLYS